MNTGAPDGGRPAPLGSLRLLAGAGVSSVFSLLYALVRAKVVAVLVGSAGVATLGQLTHILNLATFVAQWGLPTGLVSELPQALRRRDERLVARLAGTFLWTSMVMAGLTCALMLVAAPLVADAFLPGSGLTGFIRILGAALFPAVLTTTIVSLLGAHRMLRALTLQAIVAGLAALLLTIGLTAALGFQGLAWAVLAGNVAGGLIGYGIARRYGLEMCGWWSRKTFDREVLVRLASYGAAASVGSIAVQLSAAATKSLVIDQLGLKLAGSYQAAWSVSAQFTLLFAGSLGTYLLPHLSAVREPVRVGQECSSAIRLLLAGAAPPLFCLALFPERVITLLYSADFAPAAVVVSWMVVGDALKLGSRVLGTLVVSRRKLAVWLPVELLHATFVPVFTWLMLPRFGLEAPGLGYVCAVSLGFAAFAWSAKRDGVPLDLRSHLSALSLAALLVGVGMLRRTGNPGSAAILALAGAISVPAWALTADEWRSAGQRGRAFLIGAVSRL